jgi:LruC domain-containing protein
VQLERFHTDGTSTLEAPTDLAKRLSEETPGAWMVRLDDLFPSTRAALPPQAAEGGYTNTWLAQPSTPPASVRFLLTLDKSIPTASLGLPPFDPYISVHRADGEYDVHRPGMRGFAGRPSSLPTESGAASFLDPAGYPFALLVPYDWRYPLESVHIEAGGRGLARPYATFESWRASRGAKSATWYSAPTVAPLACITDPLTTQVRGRPWRLLAQ